MSNLTISPPPEPLVLSCVPPAIYVDGARRHDLELIELEELPAPDFGSALIAARDTVSERPPLRFGDAGRLPPIGASIAVRHASAPSDEFACVVVAHRSTVSDEQETLTAVCEHRLVGDLAARVTSCWRLRGGAAEQVQAARVRFNYDANTLASAAAMTVGGRSCRVFDASTFALPWTVADALGYLLAAGVLAEVDVPTTAEIDALAGETDLGKLDATGKSYSELLTEVAGRAGLEFRAASRGRGLVLYAPGGQGRSRSVRLQPPGGRLAASQSNLWRGAIEISRRPARPSLLAIGDHKRYESTFTLAKGWNPALETSRWRDFVRSMSPHWPRLGDVFRKWVLNEHGWYAAAPWNLPAHSFADIAAADFTTLSARRLLPCLSTDDDGHSLGVVVEIRLSGGGAWRRLQAGPLWVSESECAIYLGGDSLPGEYFQAAVAGTATVRVTAVIEADARLTAEVRGDVGAPRKVVDLTGQAVWRKVHPTSVFYGASDVGPAGEVDETSVLTDLAARWAQTAAGATTAELMLGWVDMSFHVGDLVDRIDGRRFELASSTARRPVVRRVRHELGERQVTHITVSG